MTSNVSPFSFSALSVYPKPTTPHRLRMFSEMRQTHRIQLPIPTEISDLDLIPSSKSGFFTHAKSRVYPLTICTHRPQSAEDDVLNVSAISEGHYERKRQSTAQQVNKTYSRLTNSRERVPSINPAQVDCSVPSISYREFRSQHVKRKNSTTPGKRQYEDHSIGSDCYNHPNATKRFYKPQVIRLTARSKIVLHSSFPIELPGAQGTILGKKVAAKPKTPESPGPPQVPSISPPKEVPLAQRTLVYSPEVNEPLALTFGEKLLKVQRVVEASRRLV